VWRGRPRPRTVRSATTSHTKEEWALGRKFEIREMSRPSGPVNLPPLIAEIATPTHFHRPPKPRKRTTACRQTLSADHDRGHCDDCGASSNILLFIVVQSTEVAIFAMIFDDPLIVWLLPTPNLWCRERLSGCLTWTESKRAKIRVDGAQAEALLSLLRSPTHSSGAGSLGPFSAGAKGRRDALLSRSRSCGENWLLKRSDSMIC